MKLAKLLLAIMSTVCIALPTAAQNLKNLAWESHGIGGGGAFYRPSINPTNNDEYYVQTDMGVIFHTLNYGQSYSQINQLDMGSALARSGVMFTNDNNIRYKIGDDNRSEVSLPYVFKSTDAGATWKKIAGFPFGIYVQPEFLFVDYNNPNRLIVTSNGKIGLSNDGGATFNIVYTDPTSSNNLYWGLNYLGGVFFDGNNIYMGGRFGFMFSTDAGLSWTNAPLTGMNSKEKILSMVGAKQGNSTRLFAISLDTAAIKDQGFCWTSNFGLVNNFNYGVNEGIISSFGKIYSMDIGSGVWTPKMNGLNPVYYDSKVNQYGFLCATSDCNQLSRIAMAENDINTVYISALRNSDGAYSILKSTDAGNNWNRVSQTNSNQNFTTGWLGEGNDYGWGYSGLEDLGVCVTNSNRIIFTDLFAIHTSSDGGATWKEAYTDPADAHAPGVTNQSKKYYKGSGIENTGLWWLQWSSATDLFAGYTDICAIRSIDGGTKWSFDIGGPIRSMNTVYTVVKHNTQNILFASAAVRHNVYLDVSDAAVDQVQTKQSWIMYSNDNGASWSNMKYFPATVYWLATDPTNNNRMYASVANYTDGIGGVYVCDDIQNLGGATWTKLPNPPRTEGHPACIKVLNDGKVLCTYSARQAPGATIWNLTNSSGVFIYDPSNAQWKDVSHPNMLWTSDIVVDPSDANQNTWYACVMGAPWYNYSIDPGNCWHKGGVYKTVNRGASWVELTDSSKSQYTPDSLRSVHSLTLNPLNTKQAIIASSSDGLWACDDITSAKPKFYRIENFPYTAVARVFFNPYNPSEMWVCTMGNGIWKATISSAGIKGVESEIKYMNVYPVPTSDKVTLSINGTGNSFPVTITDGLGKVVETFIAQQGQTEISLDKLKNGIYFLKAGMSVKKIIVNK